jgi:hypothetical protein
MVHVVCKMIDLFAQKKGLCATLYHEAFRLTISFIFGALELIA